MRLIGAAILCIGSATMVFGQRPGGTTQPYGSLGGYGNVLYPGTGHAPNANQTFPARLGATVAGHPYGPGYYSYPANAPRAAHPAGHGRSAVVPYPVYIGGGYYGGYAPDAYATPPPQEQPTMDAYGMPSVVVNQNFVPDRANPVIRNYGDDQPPPDSSGGMKLYQTPPTRPYADQAPPSTTGVRRQPGPDPQPTIYLLAFKDHNIVPALGYWMEGNTLHYVSVEHSLNQASFDLIDRDLSQRLNEERGVEFRLPAQQ
jgi:hypothetical protein